MNLVRAGAAIAAAAAVVVAGQVATRPEGAEQTRSGRATSVPATQAELVCPGAPLADLDGVEDVKTSGVVAAQVPPADVLRDLVDPPSEPGSLTLRPLGGTSEDKSSTGRRVALRGSLPGGLVSGEKDRALGLVGADEVVVGNDRALGASAAPCVAPSADQWLVGGGPGAGRQERLLLANPGDNPVSVDLTSLGKDGSESPAAGQGIAIPPRSRVALLLDGITGSTDAQVVRVKASGGPVGAWLVDHWVDGLTPRGLDVVPSTGEPSRQVVLGGIPKGESARVVVGAPGRRDAIVTVRAINHERGHSVGVATVPAGSSTSITVPSEGGIHAFTVTADEPVVAAAEVVGRPSAGAGRDVVWSVATPEIEDLVGAAVPNAVAGVPRYLEISSPVGATEAEVTTVYADTTDTTSVSLEKDRSTVISLEQADAVWVRRVSGDGLHASLLTKGETGRGTPVLAVTPLLRARVSDRTVEVVPVQ